MRGKFLCLILLLTACSSNPENYYGTRETNESKEMQNVTVTLRKIDISQVGNYDSISLSFEVNNKNSNSAVIHGSYNPDETKDVILLQDKEKIFPLMGRGGDFTLEPDPKDFIYTIPKQEEVKFDAIFRVDNDLLKQVECKIPIFIENEKIEFIFPITI